MLFPTSIKENIRFGRLNATDEEIEQIAKLVYAHEFIMQLPKNYETEVGERGVQLADSEKQKISLARALIRNPKILLLDEPTGNMDVKSEKLIQVAINDAKFGRTTIIFTNKLRTLYNADKIFLLENGHIKESGTHNELMEMKAHYFKMFNAQEKRNQKKANQTINDCMDEAQSKKSKNEQKSVTNKLASQDEYFLYELKLLKLIKGEIFSLLFGTITQTLCGAIYPATAYMFSFIFYILPLMNLKEQLSQSLQFMEIILALALIYFLSIFVKNYSFAHSSAILGNTIRKKMFESILRQDISYHDKEQKRLTHLNNQIEVIAKDCNSLTTDRISLLSNGFGGILFCITVSFLSSWKLAFILIVFIPFNLFCGFMLNLMQNKIKKRSNRSNEKLANFMLASFKNIKTLVSFDLEQCFIDQFKEKINNKENSVLMFLYINGLFQSLMSSLLFFITIVTLSFCYSIIEVDNILVHRIYQVYIPIALCSVLVVRVYNQLPDLKRARNSAKSAFEIIERKSRIDPLDKNQGFKLFKCDGQIEFKNVSFSYPIKANKKVLDNFNLRIKSNQINALVGPYGSGKSTIISLLLRFYDVNSGQITLDNVDIKDLNVAWLRSIMGVISKDTVLFDMSIKENIALGDASHFDKYQIDKISNIAGEVEIRSRIENLPEVIILFYINFMTLFKFCKFQKYDTIIGKEGFQLSTSDKQRIAIARVLMRNPKILILDEVTIALDSHSKQVVQDVLSRIQRGRTSLVIAHRIRSIKNAHTTAVIKNGQVIKDGCHLTISFESNKSDIKFYKRRTRSDTINLSFNIDAEG
jgi:ABC-type multidrug transport system fused ATPase/permease subunit